MLTTVLPIVTKWVLHPIYLDTVCNVSNLALFWFKAETVWRVQYLQTVTNWFSNPLRSDSILRNRRLNLLELNPCDWLFEGDVRSNLLSRSLRDQERSLHFCCLPSPCRVYCSIFHVEQSTDDFFSARCCAQYPLDKPFHAPVMMSCMRAHPFPGRGSACVLLQLLNTLALTATLILSLMDLMITV